MASSAFSFHCMICFEEFDPQTNYPVVLPCGHTYVCIECANRLDKCMECRTPLTMKIELPAAVATTPAALGPNHGGLGAAMGDGGPMALDMQKENQQNRYADRVRNSPGFRRRYGQRDEYRDSYRDPYNKRHYAPPPPQPIPNQRLPLPKNAVLLSLIQASEPARRRAEVEAPPTPQKSEAAAGGGDHTQPTRSETPSPGTRGSGPGTSSLTKYGRPSPLFLDGSSSGEHDMVGHHQILGSSATSDDEEHKIRVGTYLEGGPCGTYAVASKRGLLVYPTLFEHILPSSLNGLKQEDEDVVKRDVEELVKKHRASIITNTNSIVSNGNITPEMMTRKGTVGAGDGEGGRTSSISPVDTELGVSRTLVECSEDVGDDVETAPFLPIRKKGDGRLSGDGSVSSLMAGTSIRTPGVVASGEGVTVLPRDAALALDASLDLIAVDAMSEPGGLAAIDTSNEDKVDDVGVSVSLTISDDDSDADADPIGASTRTLPARRSQSIMETPLRGQAKDDSVTKKFARHFSVGSYPATHKNKCARDGKVYGGGAVTAGGVDEFDRPLVRLKYGDRVQVVSMDARGWVKLARGYGYIRLENDKQLVKVGGTSDKACQIEAMLHELSIERNRLKQEQTKLERLSAGLMIDLQSTLISSDDHVVVPAPAGLLLRSDSNLNLSIPRKTNDSSDPKASKVSLDDLDPSTRSRPVLTPPRTDDHSGNGQQHRDIRTAKSHSPGQSSCLRATASSCLGGGTAARASKAPPSPPYGQVTPSIPTNNWSNVHTPTRVNFRTGLSGHRALTSTHSHPHDFIDRPHGTIRSMSNHAGISSTKKSGSRGRIIY